MKRFEEQGMDGRKGATGRGRKGIWQEYTDPEAIRGAVAKSRQRISLVKAELESKLGKEFSQDTLRRFVKNGDRFKRIRRVLKHKPNPDIAAVKQEVLAKFEDLAEQGAIDVYYGDESSVSLTPNVPYGWQSRDEAVTLPSERVYTLVNGAGI